MPDHPALLEALVVEVRGSAPVSTGASMLLTASKRWQGTIGGGMLEWQMMRAGEELLSSDAPGQLLDFRLGPENDQCCGGRVKALLCRIPLPLQDLMQAQATRVYSLEGSAGARLLGGWLPNGEWRGRRPPQALSAMQHNDVAGQSRILSDEAGSYFLRAPEQSRGLWIFGAGHVAAALAPLAIELGFAVEIFDERPEWADPRRFPPGVQLRQQARAPQDRSTPPVVLIMTHSHRLDFELLIRFLKTPCEYLGVIGSRSKSLHFQHQLRALGLDGAGHLHMPMGLPGMGKAPLEIAISVLGELLQLRHGDK